MPDNPNPKDLLDAIEDMLEERKTKTDRRKQAKPVDQDRRSGKDRRDIEDEDDDIESN